MPIPPTFTPKNTTAAYQLRFHFGWYTRRRNPHFDSPHVRGTVDHALPEIAHRHDYHLLDFDVAPSVVRSLLSLKPAQSPAQVTRIVKGNLAKQLREQVKLRNVWSRNVFVRSVGNVSGDVIRAYIADQFVHHGTALDKHCELARFHDPRKASELRRDSHGVFEYNVHVVLVAQRRTEFLDFEVANALIDYWRRVCDKHRWFAWDIEVVWDHAHFFLGLCLKDDRLEAGWRRRSVGDVAFTMIM